MSAIKPSQGYAAVHGCHLGCYLVMLMGKSWPLLQSVIPQVYPNLTARRTCRCPVDGHFLSIFTKVLNVLKGGKTLLSGDLEI